MIAVTYGEAWALWLDGINLSEQYLWGVQILWWGRFGKILGLLSALAIVAEIIGAERLRDTGKAIRKRYILKNAWNIIVEIASSIWMLISAFFVSDEKQDAYIDQFYETRLGIFTLFVWMLSLIIIFTIYFYQDGIKEAFFASIIWLSFGGIGLALLFAAIFIFISFLLALVDFILIRPFSRLLEHKYMGKIIKIISLTLLLTGFHFDLLAT